MVENKVAGLRRRFVDPRRTHFGWLDCFVWVRTEKDWQRTRQGAAEEKRCEQPEQQHGFRLRNLLGRNSSWVPGSTHGRWTQQSLGRDSAGGSQESLEKVANTDGRRKIQLRRHLGSETAGAKAVVWES